KYGDTEDDKEHVLWPWARPICDAMCSRFYRESKPQREQAKPNTNDAIQSQSKSGCRLYEWTQLYHLTRRSSATAGGSERELQRKGFHNEVRGTGTAGG